MSESWRKPGLDTRAPSLHTDLELPCTAWPSSSRKRARSRSPKPQRLSAVLRAREGPQAAADDVPAAEGAPMGLLLGRPLFVHEEEAAAPDLMSLLAELGQEESFSPPASSNGEAPGSAVSPPAAQRDCFTADASVHSLGQYLTTPPQSPAQSDQPEPDSQQPQPALLNRDSGRAARPHGDESASLTALQLPHTWQPEEPDHLQEVVIAPDASTQQRCSPQETMTHVLPQVVVQSQQAQVPAPAQYRAASMGGFCIPNHLRRPPLPRSKRPGSEGSVEAAAGERRGVHGAEVLQAAVSAESSEWKAMTSFNMQAYGIQNLLATM